MTFDIDPAPDDPCHLIHQICERAACTGNLALTCDGDLNDRISQSTCACGRPLCAACVLALKAYSILAEDYGCPWCTQC